MKKRPAGLKITPLRLVLTVLILFIVWSVYGFQKIKQDVFKVYDVPEEFVMTSEDADLTIVDFSYHECPDCKLFHKPLIEAIKKDGKIRYIPRIIRFNGDPFQKVVVSSIYAAAYQGKMIEMQGAIFENSPIIDREALFNLASSIGLDVQKLSRDMSKPEVIQYVEDNNTYFDKWKLKRTPTLLLGKTAILSPNKEQFETYTILELFEKARSSWF